MAPYSSLCLPEVKYLQAGHAVSIILRVVILPLQIVVPRDRISIGAGANWTRFVILLIVLGEN